MFSNFVRLNSIRSSVSGLDHASFCTHAFRSAAICVALEMMGCAQEKRLTPSQEPAPPRINGTKLQSGNNIELDLPSFPARAALEGLIGNIEAHTQFRLLDRAAFVPPSISEPNLAICIADFAHNDSDYQDLLFSQLEILGKVAGINAFVLEGIPASASSSFGKIVSTTFDSIYSPDPRLRPGVGALESHPPGLARRGADFTQLSKAPNFSVVGLEEPNTKIHCALGCMSVTIQELFSMRNTLLESNLILGSNGFLDPAAFRIVRGEEYIKTVFPDVPIFPLNSFELVHDDSGDRLLVLSHHPEMLAAYFEQFVPWATNHVLDDRNSLAVKRVEELVANKSGQRVAIVLGKDHLNYELCGRSTLQELMSRQGFSTITLAIESK